MLYGIKGTLKKKENLFVVVDVNGLLFRVFVPLSTYSKLPQQNEECELFIELIIGEKTLRFYGFYTIEEKELFNALRKISKIGAQTALSILSTFSIEQFYQIIANRDEKMLTEVPGIGKKTAFSVMVEFSSKLPQTENLDKTVHDAVEALESLGFPQHKSVKIVQSVYNKNPEISIENLIKEALRLSKKDVL